MLVQFSLTNYRNFKETATLDLAEAKITEYPEHLLKNPVDHLGVLPVAAIYGANGSGKSNLLKGLWHLRTLVLDVPAASEEDCYFRFDSSCKKEPVEYEVMFRISDMEYDYQLKMNGRNIIEENLFSRYLSDTSYDVLFDRDSEGVFLCEAWEDTDVARLTDQLPLLYFLGVHKKDRELQSILNFFRNIIFFSGHQTKLDLLTSVVKSKSLKSVLLSHLVALDLDITDIRSTNKGIMVGHMVQGKQIEFSLDAESTGLRQMLSLLAALLEAREKGALVLADDPETHLHPKVLEYLYRLAADASSNPFGAQLLAATHENATMNNGVFRRDELWMMDRKEDGSSSLYTLALFLKENGEKVRKDETYFKQYLEGRYGGVPKI